ncbi:hypothetical protein GCM10020331_037040 [Ectobacillus funiculus]
MGRLLIFNYKTLEKKNYKKNYESVCKKRLSCEYEKKEVYSMQPVKKLQTLTYSESKETMFFKKIVNTKIGVIPLPLYIVLAAIIYAASVYNQLPADMIGGFAVIMIMGIFF